MNKKMGRPPIGDTRKVSITLPTEVWSFIEEKYIQDGYSVSAALRDMVERMYVINRLAPKEDLGEQKVIHIIDDEFRPDPSWPTLRELKDFEKELKK